MQHKIIIEEKHWYPIQEIINRVETHCKNNNFKNILEIGPGIFPFSLANHFVGYSEKISNYFEIDIDIDQLPFQYKSLDFVYSRHTLEDIQNPDFAMKEIIRVSNSGFIETPSPLIEITKGVDIKSNSNIYAGYIHHRYIIWSDIEKGEIYFLPKYSSIIENLLLIDDNTLQIINNSIKNPYYWNNYFIWKNKVPKIIMYKNGVNFGVNKNMIEEYIELINDAINKSISNTNFFISNFV